MLFSRRLAGGIYATLARVVQRKEEIKAFTPVPFYMVDLTGNGFEAASERFPKKASAKGLQKIKAEMSCDALCDLLCFAWLALPSPIIPREVFLFIIVAFAFFPPHRLSRWLLI